MPFIISAPRLFAPVIPVSSSTVNKASSGPCTSESSAITANDAAIPIPLSAPRVVPSACTQSPSIIVVIGVFSKSKSLLFDSHTISMCPCIINVGACSCPGVAGLLINTLPTASVFTAIPCSAAKSNRYWRILPSFFEGRGTLVIWSKIFQTSVGFKSFIVISFDIYFTLILFAILVTLQIIF